MSKEKRLELEKLFQKLDVNKDGIICLSDLIKCLSSRNLNRKNYQDNILAKHFLRNADSNRDGYVDFTEFVKYFENRDKLLDTIFCETEPNMNNTVTVEDVKSLFNRLNISISTEEADKLIGIVDSDGNRKISVNEWRDVLLFHPTQTWEQIVHFWQNGQYIDVGADWVIPDEFDVDDGSMLLQSKRLLAGGVAGALSRTCTAPLDRVKVLLQVHGYKHVDSGIYQSIRYMLNEGGFWSLWRGNGINVIKIVPESAIKFSMYEYFKFQLRKNTSSSNANQSLGDKFVAGSLAGVSAQAFIYPLETLKTRLCLRKTGQFHSSIHCIKMIYNEAGLRTFYRGFFINIAGIIPYAGIELTLYEKCKSLYMHWAQVPVAGHPNPLVIPLISSFSATCGILTTYPFALIRTKLQSKSEFSERNINSAEGLVRAIYSTAGVRGFYRGVVANLCKVLPASSISYLTYEYLNRTFNLKSFGSA